MLKIPQIINNRRQHPHVDYGTLSAPIMLQLANYTWLLREDLA
ncbi:hypothetical protein [Edaphovirga cremea]|nr:hypothetical protein [Edaphovirga cremea]